MSDMYTRFFIFSQQQMDMKTEIDSKRLGKPPTFGTVIVDGSPKVFTDILVSMNDCRFPDAKLLIAGDIRKIKYTEPSK